MPNKREVIEIVVEAQLSDDVDNADDMVDVITDALTESGIMAYVYASRRNIREKRTSIRCDHRDLQDVRAAMERDRET